MGYTMMAVKFKYSISEITDIRTVVDAVIDAVKRECALSEEKQYKIKLVMNELLTNCFKHAKPSKEKPVQVEAAIEANSLSFSVQDKGDGFDVGATVAYESDRNEEMIYRDSGRGLLLARQMASELKFNEKGNLALARIDLLE